MLWRYTIEKEMQKPNWKFSLKSSFKRIFIISFSSLKVSFISDFVLWIYILTFCYKNNAFFFSFGTLSVKNLRVHFSTSYLLSKNPCRKIFLKHVSKSICIWFLFMILNNYSRCYVSTSLMLFSHEYIFSDLPLYS